MDLAEESGRLYEVDMGIQGTRKSIGLGADDMITGGVTINVVLN